MAFMVGISGPSCSGKSTLAETLSLIIGASVVHQDDFFVEKHEYPRLGKWRNYDSPEGVKHQELYDALRSLKRGMPTNVPVYDKKLMTRVGTRLVRPTDIVIGEGFQLLYDSRIEDLFDATFYVDVPVEVQRKRREATSSTKRDYFDEVIVPMHEMYGDYRNRVDTVLDGIKSPGILMEEMLKHINKKL